MLSEGAQGVEYVHVTKDSLKFQARGQSRSQINLNNLSGKRYAT